ncbi:acyl-CoA dehydrogenase [Croceivirga thetidis]|uniref:Acyl-CoA oxidase n=1 Tax=Croceivirga thetidis TaxID=2721623 RepID=A0ABX1GL59_9FLAO|nr:acyl-CoA dehydrogenase [Croceivirga thetidis]NKI30635.1 acyl-CoA oxidase [Croceivirga thetidis]
MQKVQYSKGIAPYIPFFYVIWSDDLLSASEIQVVKKAIKEDDSLSNEERKILANWLDKGNPPKNTEVKKWQQFITQSKAKLVESEIYPLETFSQKVAKGHKIDVTENNQLQYVEKTLGIQPNHYNHLFNVEVDRQIDSLRFEPKFLDEILYGDKLSEVRRFRDFLKHQDFKWTIHPTKEGAREVVLKQLKNLASGGWGAYAYPEEYGGKDNLETYAAIFEHLMFVDGSLAVKFGVQFGLFGGSIQNLGNSVQRDKYLSNTGDTSLLGCFAMTETGHGSNVRGINTTATYLHEERSLVIDTPGKYDNKEYIGNALHSKMATVFAQLIVNGQNEGVHAILVPLRDTKHQVLDGVTIEDNGYKLGLNGVDNGKIWFSQVKVPIENLLDKYGGIDENGNYKSPIKNPNKRFFTMLGTLVGGRICVAKGALAAAKMSLTISVKHGLRRRQFNDSIKIQEDLLIDYPTHQLRLIPKVASCLVYHFALERAMYEYASNKDGDKRRIETQVAGLKSIITWFSSQAVQESREACGGKGYLRENRIADLKNDSDIFTTFEGDNTVLLQLAAKGVLSDFKSEFNSGGFASVLKLLGNQLNDKLTTINPLYVNKVDSEHLYNHKFHLHALDFRLRRLTYTAAMRIRNYIKKGMPSYQAFLKTQTHLLEVGKAYSEVLAIKWYYEKTRSITDDKYRDLFFQIGSLHSLNIIRKDAEWYLEQGYLGSAKSKAIRQRIERLSSELRPHIGSLIDGFGIPEHLLTAPISKDW